MNRHSKSLSLHPLLQHALICAVLCLTSYLVCFYFPITYTYGITEDSWVEYASFNAFLVAFFLMGWAIKVNPKLRCPGYLLLCLGLLVAAMEEISWGQRLFNWHTPWYISQLNEQSELNLHNLYFFPKTKILFSLMITWSVFIPALAKRFKPFGEICSQFGIPLVPTRLQPYFVLSFVFIVFTFAVKHNEIAEMFLGLAFILFTGDVLNHSLQKTDTKTISTAKINSSAIILVLILTSLCIWQGNPFYRIENRLLITAKRDYPQRGLNDQAEKLFQHILNRQDLRSENTLTSYGLFLFDIKDARAEGILKEALVELKKQIRTNPENPAPHRSAGTIYNCLNHHDESLREFQLALQLDEARLQKSTESWKKADAITSMGRTYKAMGLEEKSIATLKEAYDLSQDAQDRKQIKKMLRKTK